MSTSCRSAQDKHWVTSGHGCARFGRIFDFGQLHVCDRNAAHADVMLGRRLRAWHAGRAERSAEFDGRIGHRGRRDMKQWFNPGAFSGAGESEQCSIHAGCLEMRRGTSSPGRARCRTTWRLSKTMRLGETRSLEIRATMNNVFNTVQYAGVDTNVASPTFGQVTSVGVDAVVSIHVEVPVLMATERVRRRAVAQSVGVAIVASLMMLTTLLPPGRVRSRRRAARFQARRI